jgi:ubiquitin-like 1-activating enzyme E1 A
VLAVGVSGTVSETLKNLALAGVGVLQVVDDTLVTPNDVGPNLLLGRESVGLSRALACKERLQELNPRVQVVVSDRSASSLDASFVSEFDVVICGNSEAAPAVNALVRAAGGGIVFFSMAAHGRAGFVFCDASNHVFRAEGSETEIRLEVMPGFEAIRQSKPLPGKRSSPQLLALQLIWRFQAETGRNPGAADVARLNTLMEGMKAPTSLTNDEIALLARDASCELTPVCAVLGGIAGQQVLRVITRVGKPINNVFVFDSKTQIVGKIDRLD